MLWLDPSQPTCISGFFRVRRLGSLAAICTLILLHGCSGADVSSVPDQPDSGVGGQVSDQGIGTGQDGFRLDFTAKQDTGEPACTGSIAGRTVGLLHCTPEASPGYTLLVPSFYTKTYLLDVHGRVVHTWSTNLPAGTTAYLLPNGNLLRPGLLEHTKILNSGGQGGQIQLLSWDSTLLWDYNYCQAGSHCQHHDVAPLPNGNVLIVAWERKTRAEALAAGMMASLLGNHTEIWVDHVVEVKPKGLTGGEVVWEWHVWDHYIQDHDASKDNFGVVASHPERMDINFLTFMSVENDISHINSIDYNPELDQIALSYWATHEILIIDHSTTTAEAMGATGGKQKRGGDILYRWGNPQSYRAGTSADHKLFGQHDANWVEKGRPGAGNLMVFNNGMGRPGGLSSSVEEIAPPVSADGAYTLTADTAFAPAKPAWTFTTAKADDLFSPVGGSAQRLSNGNTLIASTTTGMLTEVNASGEVVWRYASPVNSFGPVKQGHKFTAFEQAHGPIVMKARRYAPTHKGLADRTLTPGGYLELPASN